MRLGLRELESLSPIAFVLCTGAVGGVLQALAEFVHNTTLGALSAALLLGAAAVVLWWLSVRRRQHAVWSAACQIAFAVGLAQLLSFALVIPRVVPGNVHLRWLDVTTTAIVTQAALTPIRFLVAAVAVALGRPLRASGGGSAAPDRRSPVGTAIRSPNER